MRSGGRTSAARKLSDLEAQELAYNLLLDAVEIKGKSTGNDKDDLAALKLKAKTLFGEFEIELSEEDLRRIEPELQEMLKLAKDRGLWGKVELSVSKDAETTGTLLKGLGDRMQRRKTPGPSDIAAKAFLYVFKGPFNILVDTAKALLTAVDRITKKVNISVRGRHGHLSLSKRDVVVARMVRRLNASGEARELPLDGATTDAAKRAARRIVFTGRGMTHAAGVSKSQDQRRAQKPRSM